MKKLLLMLLGVLIALPAMAQDFTYPYEGQTLTYTILDEGAKTVETKQGVLNTQIYDYDPGNDVSGSLKIPATVTYNNVEYTVIQIGEYGFCRCSDLTSIEIPNSVKTIGSYAFYSCTNAKSVNIGESVETIGYSAFRGCTSLEKAEFASIESLCSIDFDPKQYIDYEEYATSNPLMYAHLYINGEEVTDVVIPETVTEIKPFVFNYNKYITSVVIPNSVLSIGKSAFFFCSSLKSISFGSNIEYIGNLALAACHKLDAVVLPPSVKAIGYRLCEGSIGLIKSAVPNVVADDFVGPGIVVYYDSEGAVIEDGCIYGPDKSSVLFVPYSYEGDFVIPETATFVGYKAFKECTAVTSVTIPEGITSLSPEGLTERWDAAFYGCTSLEKVVFNAINCEGWNASTYPFPASVKELTIGENVKVIPQYAFAFCSYLTDLTIPRSVESIKENAFRGCDNVANLIYEAENCEGWSTSSPFPTGIKTLTIGDNVKTIPSHAFYGFNDITKLNISKNVSYIDPTAFAGCNNIETLAYDAENCEGWKTSSPFPTGIKTLTIGDSVKTIPSYAFYNLSNVTSAELPDSLTSIGESAFYNCSGLTSITIPKAVSYIDPTAFAGCNNIEALAYDAENCEGWTSKSPFAGGIKTLTIGKDVKTIPSYAFYNLSNVTSAELPDSLTSIGESAFYNCRGLTSLTIPNSVTYIGEAAFLWCNNIETLAYNAENCEGWTIKSPFPTGIKTLTIGKDVKSIPSHAFSNFSEIASVQLPDSLTSIGENAFYYCSELTSITISNSVTYIGKAAFSNCRGLASITIPKTVIYIGNAAFAGCNAIETLAYNAENCEGWENTPFSTSVKEVILGESVKSIPSNAFSGLLNLTSISIPVSVASIGENAFSGCSGLEKAEFASIETMCRIEYGSSTANPLYYAENLYIDGSEITSLIIPETITEIEDYAFINCTGLNSVSIPCSVDSIGDMAFYGCSGLKKNIYPNNLENPFPAGLNITYDPAGGSTIEDNIVYNGDKSIIYFAPLTFDGSWTVPSTVKLIDEKAFALCDSLKAIEIPATVDSIAPYAFNKCTGLQTIDVAANIIGENAFNGCTGLQSIDVSAKIIGERAFSECNDSDHKLNTLTIGATVSRIDDYAFVSTRIDSIIISDSDEELSLGIGGIRHGRDGDSELGMFQSSLLTNVYIGRNLRSDVGCLFDQTLKKVAFGQSITSIPPHTFQACGKLENVAIPANIDSIGAEAFYGCEKIKSVSIADGVKFIGKDAFYWENTYSALDSVSFASLNSICTINFENKYSNPLALGHNLYIGDKAAEYIEIPADIDSIGSYAFAGLNAKSVFIPLNIKTIGTDAFIWCFGLVKAAYPAALDNPFVSNLVVAYPEDAEIENGIVYNAGRTELIYVPASYEGEFSIPESVNTIGKYAFSRCVSLTGVVIPATVSEIPAGAFSDCTALANVKVLGEVPAGLGWNAFNSSTYETATLNIPENSLLAYLDTNWKEFKNISAGGYNASNTFEDEKLKYRLIENPDNRQAIVIGANGNPEAIDIPERFSTDNQERYYVTAIAPEAFMDESDLKSVKFNSRSTLTSIGTRAFQNTGISVFEFPATLTTIGESAFQNCDSLTSITLVENLETLGAGAFRNCDKLESVVINDKLTGISDYAFAECPVLANFEFGNQLDSIGNYAFKNCTSLKALDFNASLKTIGNSAFSGCTALESVNFNSGLESIGNYAFSGDTTLTSLSFPDKLISIGSDAFSGCKQLANIQFGENLETIGVYAFSNTALSIVSFPDKLISIGSDAFYNCLNLAYVQFGKNLETIGEYAFSKTALTRVSFPDKLVEIGRAAFVYAPLENVVLPNSLVTLGSWAFSGCDKLTEVVLGSSMDEIPAFAFYDCSALEAINIPENIRTIGEGAFQYSGLKSVTLPLSVDSVARYAFNCDSLTNLTIADGVTPIIVNSFPYAMTDLYMGRSIAHTTLQNRSKLANITVGNTITEIPALMFSNNTALENVTIGSMVETIGENAFKGCSALKEVAIPSSVKEIGEGAFAGNSLATINIGCGIETIGAEAFTGSQVNTIAITAQTPPAAPTSTFSDYSGNLYVQDPGDKSIINAYYDSFYCWERFNGLGMVVATRLVSDDGTEPVKGKPGTKVQLSANIEPANATLPTIYWRSTNPLIATVDPDGWVTIQDPDMIPEEVLNACSTTYTSNLNECKIIAETMYADGPVLEFTIEALSSAIDDVVADRIASDTIDYNAPYEVYNLSGMLVGKSTEGLGTGFYIVRQGRVAKKIAVK